MAFTKSKGDEELPATLLGLMFCTRKAELKKLAQRTKIKDDELANIILAGMAGVLPWEHFRHHREFRPAHLDLTNHDLRAIGKSKVGQPNLDARKAFNKLDALFDERRLLSGHLFCNDDLSDWHFVYFDQRDYRDRNNHWVGGSHVHFINYLWPRLDPRAVWNHFQTGNPIMRGSLHVAWDRKRTYGPAGNRDDT